MIVCFSGTGNSRFCADFLAKLLDDEVIDVFRYIREEIAADLISGKPWIFVSPTYAWQLPRIFSQFIRSSNFSGTTDAYFVMTCGTDTGNAAQTNRMLCAEKGLTCRGTASIVMPENYLAMFPVPDHSRAVQIVREACPLLEKTAQLIREDKDLPASGISPADRLKSGIINRLFYPMFVKAKKFTASDACIACGKCADSCILGNIQIKNGKPVWGDRCTHCMACICACPVSAIEYGKISAGKPRYHCPSEQELNRN